MGRVRSLLRVVELRHRQGESPSVYLPRGGRMDHTAFFLVDLLERSLGPGECDLRWWLDLRAHPGPSALRAVSALARADRAVGYLSAEDAPQDGQPEPDHERDDEHGSLRTLLVRGCVWPEKVREPLQQGGMVGEPPRFLVAAHKGADQEGYCMLRGCMMQRVLKAVAHGQLQALRDQCEAATLDAAIGTDWMSPSPRCVSILSVHHLAERPFETTCVASFGKWCSRSRPMPALAVDMCTMQHVTRLAFVARPPPIVRV